MSKRPIIDIIIPSYNGKHLLGKHLSPTIKNSPGVDQIIVVDDGSVDCTEQWLRDKFPNVVCLHHKQNKGFTVSINLGAKYSKADFIVLLNNDVSPLPGYLDHVMDHFDDDRVFAVSFNEKKSSWPILSWGGKINFDKGEDKTKPRYSAWASGGSAIFRKSIWDKIGGFNEIYAPAYWEDIDIGYRAWKKGYKVIWDNSSEVLHEHEASYSKFDPSYISTIKQRNELLFNWINVTDPRLVTDHLKWLVLYTLSHPGYLRIVLLSLARFIIQGRKIKSSVSDKEVLSKVNLPLE